MAKNQQRIKFEADVSGFKTNIKEAENSIKTLNNELKLNQAQLKGSKEETNLLSQRIETLKEKYEQQTEVVENTKKSYEKAVEIFGENSKEAENLKNKLLQAETAQQNIKNEIDKTNQKLTEQTDKLITTSKKWQESGKRLKDYGSKIETVGNKLSIVSGLVGGIAVASLKSSVDFETAFTGVTKTVDGTEKQLADLRQGILDMSTELPSSAKEIAGVAEAAGQLGIQTDNILEFSKTMINMGNATNLSADEAATTLARFANVTRMSQGDFDKLGSVIVALGNNYATTEAEITAMGMNLASAGTQVGMSQADIMALATALSSVGLEAQAGGTAFSKALIDMQLAVETNSDSLKDWADVAGMSTKEFSDLFKKEATSALKAFIKGLSNCKGESKSAIKVLDDMGITETRMRDALLRSANASDIFTDAIELGSKAWEENTALTEEANKFNETTESQLKRLKNEVTKTAIEFGDELAPSLRQIVKDAKPMLSSISSAVKAFADLDQNTKNNIITMGGLVIVAGPIIKFGGSFLKTIGSIKTGIGTFTGAIGVLKNGTEGASKSSIKLASSLKKIASPVGIATITITALATAYQIMKSKVREATKESREHAEAVAAERDEILQEADAIKETRASIDAGLQTDLDNIDRTQKLWEELQKITDENGKIKEGYENRAKVITGKLSEALGKEITITDNVIDNYKKMQDEIDTLILKKKGEAVLAAREEKYNKAISDREQKMQELIDKQEELNKAKSEEAEAVAKAEEARNNYIANSSLYNLTELNKATEDLKNKSSVVQGINDDIASLNGTINNYTKDIEDYEYALSLSASGTAEDIQKMVDDVGKSYTKNEETVNLTLQRQIEAQQNVLEEAKIRNAEAVNNNNETERQKSQTTIDEANRRLQTHIEELKGMTSATGEYTPEVIGAWKQLATGSYDTYKEEVSKLPFETRIKIQDMTGVVADTTPEFIDTMKNLANGGVETLEKNEEFKTKAIESLKGYLSGLKDDEKRRLIKEAGIENVDVVMKELENGDISEDKGVAILKGLYNGLENKQFQSNVINTAESLSQRLLKRLNIHPTITIGTTIANAGASAIPRT